MNTQQHSVRRFPVKYIIAGVAILVFAGVGVSSLLSSSIEYTNVERAQKLGKTVQIVGTWVKDRGSEYNQYRNTFSFHLKDQQGNMVPVVLTGAKPNNFEIAVSIVAKGRMDNGTFQATSVLTKCPSKYEGQAEQ